MKFLISTPKHMIKTTGEAAARAVRFSISQQTKTIAGSNCKFFCSYMERTIAAKHHPQLTVQQGENRVCRQIKL